MSNKNEGFWVILSWSYQCILDNAGCVLLGASRGAVKIYLNATSTQHYATPRHPDNYTNAQTRKHPDTQTSTQTSTQHPPNQPKSTPKNHCQIANCHYQKSRHGWRTRYTTLYIDFLIIKMVIRYNNLAKQAPKPCIYMASLLSHFTHPE